MTFKMTFKVYFGY